MNRAPLVEALRDYADHATLRLHMPGHGGKPLYPGPLGGCAPYDVTEISPCGDLFGNEGPVADAMDLASGLYGATTVFSAGGATLCLQAALALTCRPGGQVLVDRRCHKSVINALVLLDLSPVYLYSRTSGFGGASDYIHPDDLAELLAAHPHLQAVVLTSPTYYGGLSNITALSHLTKAAGVPLIVDNSHGAHLFFLEEGRHHPLKLGADYVIDSCHKTLPVLTGGALLHCHRPRQEVLQAMALFASSSPSFLVLASLDACRALMEGEGPALLARGVSVVRDMRHTLFVEGSPLQPPVEASPFLTLDESRLCLDFGRGATILPAQMAKLLTNAGMVPEFWDDRYLVLLLPLVSLDRVEAEHVTQVLLDAAGKKAPTLPPPQKTDFPRPMSILSPRQAALAPREILPLEQALGRVAAAPVYHYPPGIPLVCPGEQFDAAVLACLKPHFSTLMVVK